MQQHNSLVVYQSIDQYKIKYSVCFKNTEVSVSVFNLNNTEAVSVSVSEKYWSISIQYQYFFGEKMT